MPNVLAMYILIPHATGIHEAQSEGFGARALMAALVTMHYFAKGEEAGKGRCIITEYPASTIASM